MITICYLNIVSIKKKIFSGLVYNIQVIGSEGGLGIFPGHTPLLTTIKPSAIHIIKENNQEELMYLSNSILEVQPSELTILTDTAILSSNLDQERAIKAKRKAEENIRRSHNNIEYIQARTKLEKEIAKLHVINLIKK
ncbi:ATP synthase epsilon chain [Candidatus Ecksteinia adelgidicola]|nr:ATP synthase epsilon chain [Candidatus Ecksteinia adelgidicola]